MFTDFVCFQFYFRDYVAQPCSKIGTAYICSSIKVLSRNAQRRIFVDCAGVRFIIENKGLFPYTWHQVSCMRDTVNGYVQFTLKYKRCFNVCGTVIIRTTASGKPFNPWIEL